MTVPKRKFQSGAATTFISRTRAVKKLQITLRDFRRLCILKGIYPQVPPHPKKTNKGSTAMKTFYLAKDIQFLAREPLINKFREIKVFLRRLARAKGRDEPDNMRKIRINRPKIRVDHLVKERYPSLDDAIRDLDDCLALVFVFAQNFPSSSTIPNHRIRLASRLASEFLNYVVYTRAITKIFVSIKGFYVEAELPGGHRVTWIIQHSFGYAPVGDVDFKVMSTFLQFYNTMLGYVNAHLFNSSNLRYPPVSASVGEAKKYHSASSTNALDSLVLPLAMDPRVGSVLKPADFDASDPDAAILIGAQDMPDEVKSAALSRLRQQSLFKGLKVFVGRECPRLMITLAVRSMGGAVSWDPTDAAGSTFTLDDPSVTHHVIDRPVIKDSDMNSGTVLSRKCIQPQWIFDCLNACKLLSTGPYQPGATLPPHMSPFVEQEDEEDDEVADKPEQEVVPAANSEPGAKSVARKSRKGDEGLDITGLPEGAPKKKKPAKQVSTAPGVVAEGIQPVKKTKALTSHEKNEETRLREMLLPKKQKRLYYKLKYKEDMEKKEKRIIDKKKQLLAKKPAGSKLKAI